MKTGIELITEERTRQIEKEGWSPEHDDAHVNGSMAGAAACYALNSAGIERPQHIVINHKHGPVDLWPWRMESWKPSDPMRDLVKAGALIAAEIDRRLRSGAEAPARRNPTVQGQVLQPGNKDKHKEKL